MNDRTVEEFQNRTKNIVFEQEGLEGGWAELKNQISRCRVTKKIKIKEKTIGQKFWWDKKCTREKRKIRKEYRKWRIGKSDRNRYTELKRKFKQLCERKKDIRRGKK